MPFAWVAAVTSFGQKFRVGRVALTGERFDLTKQFAYVADMMAEAAQGDSTLRWGAGYAARAVDTLTRIQTFANSSRPHV